MSLSLKLQVHVTGMKGVQGGEHSLAGKAAGSDLVGPLPRHIMGKDVVNTVELSNQTRLGRVRVVSVGGCGCWLMLRCLRRPTLMPRGGFYN